MQKAAKLLFGCFIGGALRRGARFDADWLGACPLRIDELHNRGLPPIPVGLRKNPVFSAVQLELARHRTRDLLTKPCATPAFVSGART